MNLILKYTRTLVVLFVLTFSINSFSIAQCNSVVKEGVKKIGPYYTFNGQINSAKIKSGNSLEIHVVFSKGYDYRIQLSSDVTPIDKINFIVYDANKMELFNSKNAEKKDVWDFFSNCTQELIIIASTDLSSKQCVALLVGMRAPKGNHSSMRDL